MTSDWKECKLKDVCIQITDGVHNTVIDNPNGNCYLLSCKNIKNGIIAISNQDRKIDNETLEKLRLRTKTQKDDVLLTSVGTIGETAIIKENDPKYEFQRSVAIFKPNKNIIMPKFLLYSLNNKKRLLQHTAEGAVQQCLFINPLKEFKVNLPPLKTQQKIAHVLGAIDDKIELNNAINKNLEQQAQAIFKSWFIDFEPFGGTMPDDWNHGHLSDLAEIKSGKRPNKKSPEKTEEMNIPIVGAASIMGYTNEYLYNEKILVTGRVGTHGIIQKFFTPCWTSDNTLVILTKYYEFIYQILKTVDYQNMNRGSTQPLITQTDLKNIEIIIPNKNVLNDYEEKINFLMKLQNNILRENSRLTQIRDTLLPKLMNGEIDVDKVEV